MSNTVIQIENLSKKYQLGIINSGRLFKDIQTWIALKRGKEDPHSKIGQNKYNNTEDCFWALKDINLEIKQGDRVGIIGKNGAGKSTLLKILSRITAPTEGTAKIKGKVASLLEVGTGFHAELTGKENIYLNGAILGMKKKRITQKLDQIIDFSGIEHHIDTPVKRYSSGMYVRLAFAVAAHLDSDILIADEVLAVGDAEFQKKALGKMQDLSTGEGRTVLFVSHNMSAVRNLCNCGLLLDRGSLIINDEISKIIDYYLFKNEDITPIPLSEIKERNGNGSLIFTKIEFIDKDNNVRETFKTGEEITLKIYYTYNEIFENCKTCQIDLGIYDIYKTMVTWLSTSIFTDKFDFNNGFIYFKISKLILAEGTYTFNLACYNNLGQADYIKNVGKLNIVFDDYFNTGKNIQTNLQGFFISDFELINS